MKSTYILVLNRLFSLFQLEWTGIGLKYNHKLRFGDINFHITNDFEKAVEFLELPFTPTTIEDICLAVTNSPYFRRSVFFNTGIKDEGYLKFLKLLKAMNPIDSYKPVYIANYNAMLVDDFFKSTLVKKIVNLEPKGFTNEALRNRFNGHLVMKWVDMPKGPAVKEIMEEFKDFIESKFNCNFLDYLTGSIPKIIRTDFLFFYYEDLVGSSDDLPF